MTAAVADHARPPGPSAPESGPGHQGRRPGMASVVGGLAVVAVAGGLLGGGLATLPSTAAAVLSTLAVLVMGGGGWWVWWRITVAVNLLEEEIERERSAREHAQNHAAQVVSTANDRIQQATWRAAQVERGALLGAGLRSLTARVRMLLRLAIHRLDDLERQITDPELLRSAFAVDHAITRAWHDTNCIAILGGEVLQRRAPEPVHINSVLRSASSPCEHYRKVVVVPPRTDHYVVGYVAEEIQLVLTELLKNASFVTPEPHQVRVTAEEVPAGVALQVQSPGLSMTDEQIREENRILRSATEEDLRDRLGRGSFGHAVVHTIAKRRQLAVQLRPNIFGGVDAIVVVPSALLASPPAELAELRSASTDTGPVSQGQERVTAGRTDQERTLPAPNQSLPPDNSGAAEHAGGQHTADDPSAPLPQRRPAAEADQAQPTSTAGDLATPPPLPQRTGSYLPAELSAGSRSPGKPQPHPGIVTAMMRREPTREAGQLGTPSALSGMEEEERS